MTNEPKPPPFWSSKYDWLLWWKKGDIMNWLNAFAPDKKTRIIAVIGLAMALLCPLAWTTAHGIDCNWVDQILVMLGIGGAVTLRASIASPSNGKTTGAAVAALAIDLADLFGGFDMLGKQAAAWSVTLPPNLPEMLLAGCGFGALHGIRDAVSRSPGDATKG